MKSRPNRRVYVVCFVGGRTYVEEMSLEAFTYFSLHSCQVVFASVRPLGNCREYHIVIFFAAIVELNISNGSTTKTLAIVVVAHFFEDFCVGQFFFLDSPSILCVV